MGQGARPILYLPLGVHGDSNSFGRVHGREYTGDWLDSVQDPQGVPGSQGYIGRTNIGLIGLKRWW